MVHDLGDRAVMAIDYDPRRSRWLPRAGAPRPLAVWHDGVLDQGRAVVLEPEAFAIAENVRVAGQGAVSDVGWDVASLVPDFGGAHAAEGVSGREVGE